MMKFIVKLLTFLVFLLFYWGAFCILLQNLEVPADQAILAAAIGVIPLLLLFSPIFERITDRLSGLKVGAFEFEFKESINNAIKPDREAMSVSVDLGRSFAHGNADLTDFSKIVEVYLRNPQKKLVMSVDLKEGHNVSWLMLYFQVAVLRELFKLHAILFIDSNKTELQDRILGTVYPFDALQRMSVYFSTEFDNQRNMLEIVSRTIDSSDHSSSEVTLHILNQAWSRMISDFPDAYLNHKLSAFTFRKVFGDLEKNILPYPITQGDYASLYEFLGEGSEHIILSQDNLIITVRRVDIVARELARKFVLAGIHGSDQETLANDT